MVETVRPGYVYKDGVATSNFSDNRVKIVGYSNKLKIINDNDIDDLLFSLNREEDSTKVDGVVKPGEEFNLMDINQGLSSVAVKGDGEYRIWTYQ